MDQRIKEAMAARIGGNLMRTFCAGALALSLTPALAFAEELESVGDDGTNTEREAIAGIDVVGQEASGEGPAEDAVELTEDTSAVEAIATEGLANTASVAAADSESAGVAEINGVAYESIAAAVAAAQDGDTIQLTADSVIQKVVIDKTLTIVGNGHTVTVAAEEKRNNTGETHGFEIGDSAAGKTIEFSGVTIKAEAEESYGVLQLIWIHNAAADSVDVRINDCVLENVGEGGPYRHAVSMEYASGSMKYNFDLSVVGSTLSARSYVFGSGLNNGNPDVSGCTAVFASNTFNNVGGSSGIYNIHTPKAFERLQVQSNSFNSVRSGGIKYIYSAENTVVIKDNDFSGANTEQLGGVYAIMCTTQQKDYADARAYSWATELSGNNLEGQNTIIAAAAPVEVIWFPDGQAVNNTVLNNYGNSNATDEGTRYGISKWGGNESFLSMADFGIAADSIEFDSLDAEPGVTKWFYNSEESSGFYTNDVTNFENAWTEENPRHCSASLATWEEANVVTRWALVDEKGVETALVDEDGDGVITGENDIARLSIDTKTGQISASPLAFGTATLKAVVGGGEDGLIPNAKVDTLVISVQEPVAPEPSEPEKPEPVIPDNSEPEKSAFAKTGDATMTLAGAVAAVAVVAAGGAAAAACARKRS